MKDGQDQLVALLESVGPGLHRLLTKLTLRQDVAEDLMQELFINLAQSDGFTRAADPAAYAYRTAMNLAFTWRRAQQRTQAMLDGFRPAVPSSDGPLARLEADEQVRLVLDAMNELPDLQRDALTLRYIQQTAYETIAEMLGKTPPQVRALCHKAIGSLRRVCGGNSSTPTREGASHVEP
ncbi:MAG: sigma-70 family RNA polymerase sigma factor [Planctomycetes bacterium]|nr:sigma-70 family RNA polymerase sigma factor [Planctomycetota bacterium]